MLYKTGEVKGSAVGLGVGVGVGLTIGEVTGSLGTSGSGVGVGEGVGSTIGDVIGLFVAGEETGVSPSTARAITTRDCNEIIPAMKAARKSINSFFNI